MKYLIIFTLMYSNVALSDTDYACVNDCTSKGYQYGLCTERCSFGNDNQFSSPQPQQIKQTDYQCVEDCTSKGYQYNLCTDRCSF